MPYLEIITVIIVGWVAGAESGSWACVHPVINQLPLEQQIVFQKGLLKTFGRIMPVLMPLSFIMVIVLCVETTPRMDNMVFYLRLTTTILMGSMIITTIFFNVPVNISTGKVNEKGAPENWKSKRALWRFFQGYRSVILVVSFGLLVVSLVIP